MSKLGAHSVNADDEMDEPFVDSSNSQGNSIEYEEFEARTKAMDCDSEIIQRLTAFEADPLLPFRRMMECIETNLNEFKRRFGFVAKSTHVLCRQQSNLLEEQVRQFEKNNSYYTNSHAADLKGLISAWYTGLKEHRERLRFLDSGLIRGNEPHWMMWEEHSYEGIKAQESYHGLPLQPKKIRFEGSVLALSIFSYRSLQEDFKCLDILVRAYLAGCHAILKNKRGIEANVKAKVKKIAKEVCPMCSND